MGNPEHTEENSLEEVIGKSLKARGLLLSIAESCTGGRIASRVTRIPGSSHYFESACVTYSNRSKEHLLSVPKSLLEEKGAVSPEVATAMAEGIRKNAGVDLGLAVTGIAGPEGGNVEKPVGLVYISLSDAKQTRVMSCHFQGNRETIQAKATEKALEILKQYLSA